MTARRPASAGERRDRRAFVIEIAGLKRSPGSRIEVERAAPMADLVVSGSRVPEDDPVSLVGALEAVHDGVLVTGTVRASWVGACRRCLEEARGEIAVAVRELCVESGDEETTYPLSSIAVDLAPIVHDTCILELPLAPLCAEDCLGLCPECGTNRNLEPCSCRPRPDSRWSGLAVLAGGRTDAAGGAPTGRPDRIE